MRAMLFLQHARLHRYFVPSTCCFMICMCGHLQIPIVNHFALYFRFARCIRRVRQLSCSGNAVYMLTCNAAACLCPVKSAVAMAVPHVQLGWLVRRPASDHAAGRHLQGEPEGSFDKHSLAPGVSGEHTGVQDSVEHNRGDRPGSVRPAGLERDPIDEGVNPAG